MPTTVTTTVTHVTITVGDDPCMSALSSGDAERPRGDGSVFVGDTGSRIQIAGTPAQLRSFAKAIEDGAMEIERQIALHQPREPDPKVSPLGDRRERAVPCRRCECGTWNIDPLCDPCRADAGMVVDWDALDDPSMDAVRS